jgi:pyruvate dehydrogenase E2 component (dihydrolipoamide acetyltransferase)
MASDILMPKMGYDMTEGTLLRWLKREGDPVARGEPIAEIETDKVAIEVEALAGGVLRRILVQEGQRVEVGARLGIVGAPDEALAPEAGGTDDAAPAVAMAAPSRPVEAQGTAMPTPAARPERTIDASPLARRLAHERGVDLATIKGTGPSGRITREDVLAAAERETASPSAEATPAAQQAPPAPAAGSMPSALPDEQPLTRMQQTIGRRMAESKAQAPHFYVTMRVDMTEALAFRRQQNEQPGTTVKISVNDLIVKATARALTALPRLNATFAGDRLILHRDVSIAVAVALEDGLVTPVVQRVDRKTLLQIAEETASLIERTRAGKNRPEDYEGGTFTVSNLGMFEVDAFVAIINPPQVAILAAGAAQRVPVFSGEALMPRWLMSLTLSADHRVTDGATAARFLAHVRDDLEHPADLMQ